MMENVVDGPMFDIEASLNTIRAALGEEILKKNVREALERIDQVNGALRMGLGSTARRLNESILEIGLARVTCAERVEALRTKLREEKKAHRAYRQAAEDQIRMLLQEGDEQEEEIGRLLDRNDELEETIRTQKAELSRMEIELTEMTAGNRNAGEMIQ